MDTYAVVFLDMPKIYKEQDFRKALIHNMKDFILELGKDFTFIDEEYRVQVGGEEFAIDLLFFQIRFILGCSGMYIICFL